jgi:hypothetical protein
MRNQIPGKREETRGKKKKEKKKGKKLPHIPLIPAMHCIINDMQWELSLLFYKNIEVRAMLNCYLGSM